MSSSKNARFWVWYNDGWIKLTLSPEQTLSHNVGGRTDEGYSYTHTEYYYDSENNCVLCEVSTDESDCDGPMSRHYISVCSVDELAFIQPPGIEESNGEWFPWRPNWKRAKSVQRDQYAQAMGY